MKVNTIKTGVEKISLFLLGENKFGKTTLFADTVMEKFGAPEYGCMLAIGGENPATMLDYVGVEQIDDYHDFFQAIKDLINRAESYEKVQMVAIDTVDELIPMLEAKVLEDYNKEKLQEAREKAKKYTPIKSVEAMGFNRGPTTAARLLKDSITALRKAGFGVWVIGHSARKVQTSKTSAEGNEVSYERLKSSLSRTYDEALRNIMDMTLTGTIEFEDYDERIDKDFRGNEKTVRTLTALGKRYLYFRETPFVDASCYFAMGAVPERIPFDQSDNSKLFIETIEEGQKLSSAKYRKGAARKAEEKRQKEEASGAAPEPETEPDIDESLEPENNSEIQKQTGPSKNAETELDTPLEPETADEPVIDEPEFKTLYYTEEDIKSLQEELKAKYKSADRAIKKTIREKLNGRTVSELPPEVLEELIADCDQV